MDRTLVKTLKALSDPNRLKILEALSIRESLCVCEIQSVLGVSQPTASNHLKILEQAGIIGSERDGMWVNYTLKEHKGNEKLNDLVCAVLEWTKCNKISDDFSRKVESVNRRLIQNV